jgi:hypothetical protein
LLRQHRNRPLDSFHSKMINSAPDPSRLTANLFATVIWSALHTFQFGFHIAALNGISDVVVCPGVGGGVDTHSMVDGRSSWPSKCINMTVRHKPKASEASIAVALTRLSRQQTYQFGIVTSIFLLGGLPGAIFTGQILDKYGRRVAQRISSCIVLLGCILLALASSFWAALVTRSISHRCSVSRRTLTLASPLPQIHHWHRMWRSIRDRPSLPG